MSPLDELLALDRLTLRHLTDDHAAQLAASLSRCRLLTARAGDGSLAGYALLRPAAPGEVFVPMLNVHPAQRHRATFAALFHGMAALRLPSDTVLVSHVYLDNAASLRFHRRLGFAERRRNERAVEFAARLAELRLPFTLKT